MAVEAKRACGYRKVGGIYLVSQGFGVQCDRLPLLLETCPCCGAGIKQARGWTWVDVASLVGGMHPDCQDGFPCPFCMSPSKMGRAGLLWIGAQFYPTVASFVREAEELGISKRIAAVPQGFVLNETWVLLAHPRAVPCDTCQGTGDVNGEFCSRCRAEGDLPGVFWVFRPTAIEKIVTETESLDEEEMRKLRDRGLTPVVVPDNDPDHRGSVYESSAEG